MTEPLPNPSLLLDWDDEAFETLEARPAAAHFIVLFWGDVPNIDGGVPDCIGPPLARALASLGEVRFRHVGPVPAAARSLGKIRASRLPWSQFWELIASSDPATLLALFDTGWAQGHQTALFTYDDDRARELLTMDTLAEDLLGPEELLFSAVVDGAGMLVAAGSERRLDAVVTAMDRELGRVGIPLAAALPGDGHRPISPR